MKVSFGLQAQQPEVRVSENDSGSSLSIRHLILVPAIISLAITLLRLFGEPPTLVQDLL